MEILTTAVAVGSTVQTVDTIRHLGKLWLVLLWADGADGKTSMPARLLCLSVLPHQVTKGLQHDFVLTNPLPQEMLDPEVPLASSNDFIAIDLMQMRFPAKRATH